MNLIIARALYSLFTLYMIAILLRWLGPWIELDFDSRRLRWIAEITDPLVNRIRRLLPSMGPMDFGPLAAIFAVWVVRQILTQMVSRMA
ncbi:MAG: YggT family protein [Candidatus Hydrogenedentes bacterium]|nr:YggT family protein [Candidatus Hydrogenedentota bacterium]